jgi:anti-sigma B factor antagonist
MVLAGRSAGTLGSEQRLTERLGVDTSVTVIPSQDGDDICVVQLIGEIDVFASPEVKSALVGLIKEGHNLLVIDFAKVAYIDSTGLGALVAALKGARENGGSIAVVCTNPQIRRIFDITGLVKVFGMFEDVEAAREDLRNRFVSGNAS